jgi:hypothetical protein
MLRVQVAKTTMPGTKKSVIKQEVKKVLRSRRHMCRKVQSVCTVLRVRVKIM